jgi:hypothetical protein
VGPTDVSGRLVAEWVGHQGTIPKIAVPLTIFALCAFPIDAGSLGSGRLKCHILDGFYVVRLLAAVTTNSRGIRSFRHGGAMREARDSFGAA